LVDGKDWDMILKMSYPEKMQKLISFFMRLSPIEKRENLVWLANQAEQFFPRKGELFDIEDVRKDRECSDVVGVHIKVMDKDQDVEKLLIRVSLGKEVQTLTRAMAVVLCEGLDGASIREVLELKRDFVLDILGEPLVRTRSRTVYYMLERLQELVRKV
jgi:cysteine desulfuration protein SufE